MPISPRSPSWRTISYGKLFVRSSSSATSATSPSAKSRTVRRISSWSSERSKSMVTQYERSFTRLASTACTSSIVTSMAVNARSEDTRERIHEAGLELFDERGYTGTSVRDLAERCGLTPGALYNHYASKDDLLFAIVDRVHDLADDVLSRALREADGGAEAKLEAMA